MLAVRNQHQPGESNQYVKDNNLSLPYQHRQRHVRGHGDGLDPLHGRQHRH